jgi:hypothetical protein
MRYSIMLQLVGLITLILVGTAAFFAWLQNRPVPNQSLTLEVSSSQKLEDGNFKRSEYREQAS